MDYELVIAFQRMEQKLDDIGLMVAQLVMEGRKNGKTKKGGKEIAEEIEENKEEKEEDLEIVTAEKEKAKRKVKNEPYPSYS